MPKQIPNGGAAVVSISLTCWRLVLARLDWRLEQTLSSMTKRTLMTSTASSPGTVLLLRHVEEAGARAVSKGAEASMVQSVARNLERTG